LIYSVEPRFSKEAEKKRLGGKCIVSVTVSATGTPLDIHITKSIAEGVREEFRDAALSLDENCVKAVEQYRFKPGTYQGRPVPVELRVEVTYNGY
jgi:protein TonB